MSATITITGEDIVGWDDNDSTAALKELGIDYDRKRDFNEIMKRSFQVDIDFVIRHGLIDNANYDAYKATSEYKRFYEEGRQAFLSGGDESNPYHKHKDRCIQYRVYPWYDGYREIEKKTRWERYRIEEMQNRIRAIIAEHELTLHYCDEYHDPYAKTPEGYSVKLA